MKALKAFAEEHGALLIVDEAQTGFGRTGKWFAIEHHGVEPDILVVSKSSGGGYPVSAVITNDKIADRMANEGFTHLASHQSDPVAAAAVAALIDIVKEEGLVERAAHTGQYFAERLRELQSKHPIIADVRGQGLMLGLELGQDSRAAEGNGGIYELAMLVVGLCKQRGVHMTYTYFEPVLRFLPPLTITTAQIDFAVSVLDESLGIALKREVSLGDVIPKNPFTRKYVDKLTGKNTVSKIASRLYETSPSYWIKKLNELTRS
jgi:4-aminobutyrate aminotransferase-like enzyme